MLLNKRIESYTILARNDEEQKTNVLNIINEMKADNAEPEAIQGFERMLDDMVKVKDVGSLAINICEFHFLDTNNLGLIEKIINDYLESNDYESIRELTLDDCSVLANKINERV